MRRQEQEPLHDGEVAAQRSGGEIEHLHCAPRPASTLHKKRLQALRRQANGQAFAKVSCDVSIAKQRDAEQHILRYGLSRQNIADATKRGATGHRVRAAAERSIPTVAARHNRLKEKALIVWQRLL